MNEIQQWLINIQARAPNSPVIIVGTHLDVVKDEFPPSFSDYLQVIIISIMYITYVSNPYSYPYQVSRMVLNNGIFFAATYPREIYKCYGSRKMWVASCT